MLHENAKGIGRANTTVVLDGGDSGRSVVFCVGAIDLDAAVSKRRQFWSCQQRRDRFRHFRDRVTVSGSSGPVGVDSLLRQYVSNSRALCGSRGVDSEWRR